MRLRVPNVPGVPGGKAFAPKRTSGTLVTAGTRALQYPTKVLSLRPSLENLYRAFDHTDSATDPVHIVRRYDASADREIAGFCAAGLAFGRVASVLNSIESLLAVMGSSPAAFVRTFDPVKDGRRLAPLVHRWIRGKDLVALLLILQRMLQQTGSIERFFMAGDDPSSPDVAAALESFSTRALANGSAACLWTTRARARRGLLLLPAALGRQRVQAAESVPALDGAQRRHRPWRLVASFFRATDRPSGYSRHPGGAVPSADALPQSGLEDGSGNYLGAAPDES